ncbi:hypothetical protein JCM11251_002080 [Rhodosporidiobolus azoricus]
MSTPDIVPSSEQGQALQAAIQKQLATLGWSTEDDPVMAEYCLVMLGNRKTAEQISTELSDLIGGDFDPSFVSWLFEEVKKHYHDPSSSTSAASPPANAPSGPASSRAAGPNGVPSRPAGPIGGGGRNVFGAAVGGVKRGAADLDGQGTEGRQQRQRFDGNAPSGPRGAAGQNGKGLFDRLGGNNPQFAPGRSMGPVNNTGMPQPAFDAITQTVQAVLSGAHPSILANIPFPALASHPSAQRLPPHVMAQAQANAVAQAQAMAAMQNVWNTPPGGPFGAAAVGGASAFNPQAPAFNPAFAATPPSRGPRPAAAKATPPVVLPGKPAQEAICKHGVDCSKPQCPYSHPSPVATKESGLVLSSEPCEKQLKCEDADCSKSHVSKAQLTAPPSAVSSGPSHVVAPSRPGSSATAAAAAAGTPCKFGAACTRPGCFFTHPWDVSGMPTGTGGGAAATPCRYGAACTRADCHFSHPSNRPFPGRKSYSASFNKSSPAGAKKAQQESGIGAWPKESADHVSERLKRFSGGESGGKDGEDGVERIVPGGDKEKDGDENKVEIHLDDDEEDKVKKEGAAATA